MTTVRGTGPGPPVPVVSDPVPGPEPPGPSEPADPSEPGGMSAPGGAAVGPGLGGRDHGWTATRPVPSARTATTAAAMTPRRPPRRVPLVPGADDGPDPAARRPRRIVDSDPSALTGTGSPTTAGYTRSVGARPSRTCTRR